MAKRQKGFDFQKKFDFYVQRHLARYAQIWSNNEL